MRHFVAAACCVAALLPIRADEYRWLSNPTPASSPELVKMLGEIVGPRLSGVTGVPVQDLHWRADDIDVHLVSGVLHVEPPLAGYPFGAYFAGQAKVSLAPPEIKPRADLRYWFGDDALQVEATELYFFTLRGAGVAEQIGAGASPSVRLDSPGGYNEMKAAFGQLGSRPLHGFLNREGRARDLAYVIVNAPKFRVRESKRAFLMYCFEPDERLQIRLRGAGHVELRDTMPAKMFWTTMTVYGGKARRFESEGAVREFRVDLRTGAALDSAEETTSIAFTPAPGVSAVSLSLTPELEVQSVTGPGGAPAPFLQWTYLKTDPNFDRQIVVSLGATAGPDREISLVVTAKGQLFEPYLNAHFLREEDDWLPHFDDSSAALYEIVFSVPKDQVAVAPGRLVEEVVDGGLRRYRFKGERPQKSATVYFGKFIVEEAQVDGTTIRLYGDENNLKARQNIKYALQEISNSYGVFTELFGPLDTPVLRVAGVPTSWGRGFDGLVLLSQRGAFDAQGSFADVFRAHEIAHQWWGNLVRPRNWPEDRWLSEAFAEYSAFEYYRKRFSDSAAHRRRLEDWALSALEASSTKVVRLDGEVGKLRRSEVQALVDGGANVYDKGPLVLHMLRHMFRLVKGNDEAFWAMLRDFASSHRYATASTDEFAAHATKALGADIGWFWDQWVYGGEVPVVEWTWKVAPANGKFALEVLAEQKDTDFMLSIPVYVKFGGDRGLIRPLPMKGRRGQLQLMLPEKPASVSLNDFYESLVILRKKE